MPKANPAFMKPHDLSPELEAVVGKGPLSRPEITKKMWDYIKAHNLQDPNDKRTIVADENLKKVFGGESKVNMMKLATYVSKNLKN